MKVGRPEFTEGQELRSELNKPAAAYFQLKRFEFYRKTLTLQDKTEAKKTVLSKVSLSLRDDPVDFSRTAPLPANSVDNGQLKTTI